MNQLEYERKNLTGKEWRVTCVKRALLSCARNSSRLAAGAFGVAAARPPVSLATRVGALARPVGPLVIRRYKGKECGAETCVCEVWDV